MNEEETTPPPKPERRDAAENRQRILNAALQLFERHGVEQVSMNQIAAEAQIGPGTLYRRYRNKSELCLDLMKDNLVILFEDIYAYLEDNRSDAPGSRLRGILALFMKFREKKSQLLRGVEDSSQANRPSSRTKGPLYHELHEILVQLFDEMLAVSGQSGPNSVFRADMLLNGVSSESYLFQLEVRGYTTEQILEHLCDTFITGH
ncbi:TetR/AcrR family transcriptional regulator [Paenibacillus glycanilyticus]|uniref:TetR/AcrR family transcriptional regulator n=1 Tax=Paenibacillus glycanilyticus TaxID=126569 RepID=UPI00203E83EF|nr:TetR/AcrR family transcriptional regulator [Paenibacillus glycanilyticus]MCM3628532.1 TetR/AcrR family transcriptional regulator [Paenibacillus glycanilyticus]